MPTKIFGKNPDRARSASGKSGSYEPSMEP